MAEVISYTIVGFSFIGGLAVISSVIKTSYKHKNKPKDYYNE